MEKKARTKCEIYTRVMGYHRPVSSFNISNKNFIEKYLVEEC